MKKLYVLFTLALPLLLISCSTKNKKQEESKPTQEAVGADKDQHGCITSAGYIWSDVLQECVRPWEVGILFEKIENAEDTAVVIFSTDSLQVELIIPGEDTRVLERRSAQDGYVWNQEDDDTFNLSTKEGRMYLSKRQNVIYAETLKAE